MPCGLHAIALPRIFSLNFFFASVRRLSNIFGTSLSSASTHGSLQVSRLDHLSHLSVCQSVCQSVCLSVCLYYGKTSERIQMPFGMVSGVGRGVGVLDGVVIVEGERAVSGVSLGRTFITIGDFDA